MEDEVEANNMISAKTAQNVLQIQIQNRLNVRQQLWEKVTALDAEIAGLREAQHQLDKLT